MKHLDELNNFVLNFLTSCDRNKLVQTWKSRSVQQMVKNILQPDRKPRHKSAYMIFCDEYRPIVMKENPTWVAREIMTDLAKKWKRLKEEYPDEYRKYEEAALQLREQTDAQRAESMMSIMQEIVKDDSNPSYGTHARSMHTTHSGHTTHSVHAPVVTHAVAHATHTPTHATHTPTHATPTHAHSSHTGHLDYLSSSEEETAPSTDERYRRYVKYKMEKIKKLYPDFSTKELLRMMKEKWSMMPEHKRSRY